MNKMIRIPAAIVLLASSFLTVQAGSIDTSAEKMNAATVADRTDSSSSNTKKICTCQLMNVVTIKAGKYSTELVGIFAEKTLEGRKRPNYRLIDEYIRREKLYFRIVFVKAVELEEKIKATTNCWKLYYKLKSEHSSLLMYNILDVDLLYSLVRK
jgi:hypothetical protein